MCKHKRPSLGLYALPDGRCGYEVECQDCFTLIAIGWTNDTMAISGEWSGWDVAAGTR